MQNQGKFSMAFYRFAIPGSLLIISLLLTGCSGSSDAEEARSHINRAETYSQQGQFRSAILEIRNAINKDPNNVDYVIALAETFNVVGAYKQTSDLLGPWLQKHPSQVALPLATAYIGQGKHLSAIETLTLYSPQSTAAELEKRSLTANSHRLAGATGKAVDGFRAVLEQNPDHKGAVEGLAETFLATDKPDAAIKTLRDWTVRNGKDPEILFLSGLAHYRLGDAEQATAILTDATSAVPSSDIFLPVRHRILTLLSRSLTEQGRIDEAQLYNKILADNINSDARERAELAIEAINRGDLDTARSTLEDLIRQNPDNERVALMLGALKLQEGNREEAESLLTNNIDAETTPTPFIRAATIAQVDGGKRSAALATLSRAIKARPNDSELLAMHGLLALSLPEHQPSGIASLSKALELDPSRTRLRLALAQHHLSQGQKEQALAQMRVAFNETPSDWLITQNYLALLLGTGESAEAQNVKDVLLGNFEDHPTAIALAAITEHRLGETEKAQIRLEKQIQSSPDSLSTLVALSSIHESQGRTGKAAETLRQAAALKPDNITLLRKAGQQYSVNHSADDLVDWLIETGTRHPDLTPNSLSLAAEIRLRQGRLGESRDLLSNIPANSQTDVTRSVRGALLVAEAGLAARDEEWETARSKAAEAISLQPDNLRFALVPINLLAREGDLPGALKRLDQLEAIHGQAPSIDLTRTHLIRLTEDEEAAWNFLQTRWRDSQQTELLPTLVSLAKSQAPELLDSLTKAWVDGQPENPAADLIRAEFLMANGDEQGAISHYQSAIARQPDNPIALNNLAWLLREQDLERAVTLASQAHKFAPENPAILDTYGWILHLAGRHQEARPVIAQALALAPDSKEIRQHLDSVNRSLQTSPE